MGAFQFSQPTWNEAAGLAGLPALDGVRPNTATKADQDTLAVALYNADGRQPWYDPCP
jgi:Transglycosylase-like domain